MRITPYHESISEFFRENYIFDIPKYQRNYAWDKTEIDDFIRDLRKCYDMRSTSEPLPHFFGGIVSIIEEGTPGGRYTQIHIIDGQQRLATFVMLVANIVFIYNEMKEEIRKDISEAEEEAKQNLSKYCQLVEKRSQELTRKYLRLEIEVRRNLEFTNRLTVSDPDRQFFDDLISGHLPVEDIDTSRESHKRLRRAFQDIGQFLEKTLSDLPGVLDKLDALKRIEEILDEDFTVIHMITETKKVAYRLFQVLNDRGTQLTVGDLLRARTLEMLDPEDYSIPQDIAKRAWDDIVKDKPNLTRSFLKWYYASRIGRRPGNATLLDDFLEEFFPKNQHSQETIQVAGFYDQAKEIASFAQNLQNSVQILRSLIEGEWPYVFRQPITQWHRNRLRLLVVELNHSNCMPLLLAAKEHLDHRKFSEIVQILERFAFRYKIICNQHISPLTRIYNKQAQAIRTSANATPYRIERLRGELRSLQSERAPNSVFRTNLNELTYKTRGSNKPLKYFLMTLEHYARWYNEGASGKPECRETERVFDFANTTIEHIYPRNPDNPIPELEVVVNDLGNLTFLGPDDNNEAGNKGFLEKKPIFQASSVSLNRRIAENDLWDKTKVEERQEALVRMALKIFSV